MESTRKIHIQCQIARLERFIETTAEQTVNTAIQSIVTFLNARTDEVMNKSALSTDSTEEDDIQARYKFGIYIALKPLIDIILEVMSKKLVPNIDIKAIAKDPKNPYRVLRQELNQIIRTFVIDFYIESAANHNSSVHSKQAYILCKVLTIINEDTNAALKKSKKNRPCTDVPERENLSKDKTDYTAIDLLLDGLGTAVYMITLVGELLPLAVRQFDNTIKLNAEMLMDLFEQSYPYLMRIAALDLGRFVEIRDYHPAKLQDLNMYQVCRNKNGNLTLQISDEVTSPVPSNKPRIGCPARIKTKNALSKNNERAIKTLFDIVKIHIAQLYRELYG